MALVATFYLVAGTAAKAADSAVFLPVAKPEMLNLIPTFPVLSLQRAADFYVNKMGFQVVLPGNGTYAMIGRDAVQIGLSLDRNATKGYKQSVYIQMARIEEYYKEVKDRGVKMTKELSVSPAQMKEFSITDPDGTMVIFGEYVGPK